MLLTGRPGWLAAWKDNVNNISNTQPPAAVYENMLSSTASKVIEHVARPLSSWPGTEEQEAPLGKEGTKDLDKMAVDAVEKAEHAGDRGKQDPQPKDNYDVRMNGFAKLQD